MTISGHNRMRGIAIGRGKLLHPPPREPTAGLCGGRVCVAAFDLAVSVFT